MGGCRRWTATDSGRRGPWTSQASWLDRKRLNIPWCFRRLLETSLYYLHLCRSEIWKVFNVNAVSNIRLNIPHKLRLRKCIVDVAIVVQEPVRIRFEDTRRIVRNVSRWRREIHDAHTILAAHKREWLGVVQDDEKMLMISRAAGREVRRPFMNDPPDRRSAHAAASAAWMRAISSRRCMTSVMASSEYPSSFSRRG